MNQQQQTITQEIATKTVTKSYLTNPKNFTPQIPRGSYQSKINNTRYNLYKDDHQQMIINKEIQTKYKSNQMNILSDTDESYSQPIYKNQETLIGANEQRER